MKKRKLTGLLIVMTVCTSACGQSRTMDASAVQETETVTETTETKNIELDIDNNLFPIDKNKEAVLNYKINENTDSYAADDGTEVLKDNVHYLLISSDKNQKAADAINADIASRLEERKKLVTDMAQTAKEDQKAVLSNIDSLDTEMQRDFISYENTSDVTLTRNDARVISGFESTYFYTGGAHGNSSTEGYTYDATTGNRIKFSDLSDDPTSWKENILADVEEQCKLDSYQQMLFEDYETTLVDSVFSENNWYFSNTGLVIFCEPYAIGPYASGTIRFVIPYENLESYGMKSTYAYSGSLEKEVQERTECEADLDGDGNEDTIEYICYYDSDQDNDVVSLLINGKDFKDVVTKNMDVQDPYNSTYFIYDMNTDDKTVEIGLKGWAEDLDRTVTTYFFRYSDEKLTYLGSDKGDLAVIDTSLQER